MKTTKATECLGGILIFASAKDITIHAVGIRPIRLCGYCRESPFLDELPRDLRSSVVELVRSVCSVSDEHEPTVADQLHKGSAIRHGTSDRMRILTGGSKL